MLQISKIWTKIGVCVLYYIINTKKIFDIVSDAIYPHTISTIDENAIFISNDDRYCCVKDDKLYCMNKEYDYYGDTVELDSDINEYVHSGIDVLTALEIMDL